MNSDTAQASGASWADLLHGANALRSIALAGGVALHAINVYIVTTILPSIIKDIGGLEYYAWNTTLFVVTSIVGSALSARLIQAWGPKAAYLLAVAVFSAGSVVCALAPSMPWMLAGRSIQGLGGGVLFALSYALIRIVFDAALWSRAMALVSGMWGSDAVRPGHRRHLRPDGALAPGVLDAAARRRAAGLHRGGQGGRQVDGERRAAQPGAAGHARTAGGQRAGHHAGQPVQDLRWNLAGIAAGLAIALLIARVDTRAGKKLLPSGAYTLATPLGSLYAIICLVVAAITTEIFVPYFLQTIHGFSPLAAGYMTAAMAAGWTLAAMPSATRSGAAADGMMRLGPAVVLAALVLLAILMPLPGAFGSPAGLAGGALALAAVGFGIGLGWPHLLTRVFNAAPAGQETLTSSSITTVQLYATALTAALAGVITNSAGLAQPGGVEGARQAALWLFAAFSVAPALALVLLIRHLRR